LWWRVLVYFPEVGITPAEVWEDGIRGNCPLDAAINAMNNWTHSEWIDVIRLWR